MRKTSSAATIALALTMFWPLGNARAQQATRCPSLPADSTLRWEEVRAPDLLFCKAMDGDAQVFSVMLAAESPFNPSRSQRAETSTIHGQEARWYRTEIASRPDLQARETSIELPGGAIAYFNVQAESDQALQRAYAQISALDF